MPCKRTRNIRTAIQRTVLPRLRPGSPLPPARVLARALRMTTRGAHNHLRAALAEAGVDVWWCREFGCLVVGRVG